MDYRQLRYFRQIVADGSFTRAADRLHVAQPALSRQVKKLEAEFGVNLLIRSREGVKLTPAGILLQEYAQRILQEFEAARAALVGVHGQRLVLRMGAPPSMGEVMFARLAQHYRKHQTVRLLPMDVWSRDVPERLRDGRLDIAIVTHPQLDPKISLTSLLTEPIYLIGPRHAKIGPIKNFASLAGIPLICMSADHGQRLWLEQLACDHGIKLKVQIETESAGGMVTMAAQGLGFALLPIGAVRRDAPSRRLRAVPIPGINVTRYMALHSGRPISAELQELILLIRAEINRFKRKKSR
jgi:LysR family transcriptional regulator, nitrogen assimilation regulatory protein